jgi:hypothetical protein
MTTFGLPHTLNYATVELASCLVTLSARAYGSRVRFRPLRIRHGGRSAWPEPARWVQFVQLDQHKRLGFDFTSASHAGGRWFDPATLTTAVAVALQKDWVDIEPAVSRRHWEQLDRKVPARSSNRCVGLVGKSPLGHDRRRDSRCSRRSAALFRSASPPLCRRRGSPPTRRSRQ